MDTGIKKPFCKHNMQKVLFILLTVPANFLPLVPGLSSFDGFEER